VASGGDATCLCLGTLHRRVPAGALSRAVGDSSESARTRRPAGAPPGGRGARGHGTMRYTRGAPCVSPWVSSKSTRPRGAAGRADAAGVQSQSSRRRGAATRREAGKRPLQARRSAALQTAVFPAPVKADPRDTRSRALFRDTAQRGEGDGNRGHGRRDTEHPSRSRHPLTFRTTRR